MPGWFRIPESTLLSDDIVERDAAVWLMGRWHFGGNPSVAELKRHTGWGWDRCAAFAGRLWTWAGEWEIKRPEKPPGKTGSNRGGVAGKPGRPDPVETPAFTDNPGDIGEASGSNRGASCARDPLVRETETPEDKPRKGRESEAPGKTGRADPHPTPGNTGTRGEPVTQASAIIATLKPVPERPPLTVNGRPVPEDLPALFGRYPGGYRMGSDAVIKAFLGIDILDTRGVMGCTVDGLKVSTGFGGRQSNTPQKIADYLAETWGIVLPLTAPANGKHHGPEWAAKAAAAEAANPGILEAVGLRPSAWSTPQPPTRIIIEHP